MTRERILQIVPRCNGAPSGVGDYAVRVAERLVSQSGIETVFLSGTPGDVPSTASSPFVVSERKAKAVMESLTLIEAHSPFSAMVLHLSGYGFAPRGAPIWLSEGLARWRRQRPNIKFVTVFHELYAAGKPWQSSFWLGPLQRAVTRRIWKLSDHALTTNLSYASDLAKWRPNAKDSIITMPVCSTVGESCDIVPYECRSHAAVVFGSAGVEASVYEAEAVAIEHCVTRLKIAKVFDIGIRRKPLPAVIAGAQVVCLGRLSSEAIGQVLADCRIGLMVYDISRLAKSTIFAAYAAHGVVPVCLGPDVQASDGLVTGQHFLQPTLPNEIERHMADIQRDVVAWYRKHDVGRLIDIIAEMCCGSSLAEKWSRTASLDLRCACQASSSRS